MLERLAGGGTCAGLEGARSAPARSGGRPGGERSESPGKPVAVVVCAQIKKKVV